MADKRAAVSRSLPPTLLQLARSTPNEPPWLARYSHSTSSRSLSLAHSLTPSLPTTPLQLTNAYVELSQVLTKASVAAAEYARAIKVASDREDLEHLVANPPGLPFFGNSASGHKVRSSSCPCSATSCRPTPVCRSSGAASLTSPLLSTTKNSPTTTSPQASEEARARRKSSPRSTRTPTRPNVPLRPTSSSRMPFAPNFVRPTLDSLTRRC